MGAQSGDRLRAAERPIGGIYCQSADVFGRKPRCGLFRQSGQVHSLLRRIQYPDHPRRNARPSDSSFGDARIQAGGSASQKTRIDAGVINVEDFMTSVTSPMVGKILNIHVKVGDKVQEDEIVMVMEAMKMEIPIVAPAAGTIKEIKVAVGDTVESEAVVALMD